jgi:rfaE bifunctional protein nucleotidyltransferase chain/domain/rfaE bifunctional protein kinase chain/domain
VTARRTVVVVGDTVLDRDVEGRVERVAPDAPVPVVEVERESAGPGGAGLTALLCEGDDVEVTLVTPLAADAEGSELRRLLGRNGVRLIGLPHEGPTRVKTRIRAHGQSIARLDTGGPGFPDGPLPDEAARVLADADVVLVSCYGAGTTTHEGLRAALTGRAAGRPVVWDPHPKGGLPVPGCALVTPNLAEARAHAGMPFAAGDQVARHLVDAWSVRGVAVTGGSRGAWLATSAGEPLFAPATPATGDTAGAGDRFAAAAALALAGGRTGSEAVVEAVARAGAFVAAGGAAGFRAAHHAVTPAADPEVPMPAADLAAEVRSRGGTVVATGGCFDVLHAGHVQVLEAARRLGDALVVLLNSDGSARRLKGPGRPVNGAEDRARVLLGLSCVDAVVVFDEDDPRACLDRLRPDVWAKGGDYEGTELPEAGLVRSWGGRVVLLPYLSGRSTTAVLESVLQNTR